MKSDEDAEKDLEQMDEVWLQVYRNEFMSAINGALSRPFFKQCEFDMASLKIGKPCGVALWDELCDSDLAVSIAAVLKKFEAELVALHINRIVIERRSTSAKYSVDDGTLFVAREFGALENGALTGSDKLVIKSDLYKGFENWKRTLELYEDEDDPYAAFVDRSIATAEPGWDVPRAIPMEERLKKAPAAPIAPPAAVDVVPQARATPPAPPPGPGRKTAVASPAASARAAPPPMRGVVAAAAPPPAPPPAARSATRGAIPAAPPARAMQARAIPKPPPIAGAPAGASGDVTPTFRGTWSLRERKMIAEKLPVLEKATATIKERLGDKWKVTIDWEAFAKFSADKGIDRPAGDNVLVKLVAAFVKCDLDKCDSTIIDAINEKCTEKEVRFTMEESLSRDRRVTAICNYRAVQITLSGKFWGFAYNEDCLNQFMIIIAS
jgi:hypothetical protein